MSMHNVLALYDVCNEHMTSVAEEGCCRCGSCTLHRWLRASLARKWEFPCDQQLGGDELSEFLIPFDEQLLHYVSSVWNVYRFDLIKFDLNVVNGGPLHTNKGLHFQMIAHIMKIYGRIYVHLSLAWRGRKRQTQLRVFVVDHLCRANVSAVPW